MGNITPAAGFILVKLIEQKQGTTYVAEEEGSRSSRGVVVSVGASTIHSSGDPYPPEVKVEDKIIFKPYGVEDLTWENEDYMIIPFDNVRGVINE